MNVHPCVYFYVNVVGHDQATKELVSFGYVMFRISSFAQVVAAVKVHGHNGSNNEGKDNSTEYTSSVR